MSGFKSKHLYSCVIVSKLFPSSEAFSSSGEWEQLAGPCGVVRNVPVSVSAHGKCLPGGNWCSFLKGGWLVGMGAAGQSVVLAGGVLEQDCLALGLLWERVCIHIGVRALVLQLS